MMRERTYARPGAVNGRALYGGAYDPAPIPPSCHAIIGGQGRCTRGPDHSGEHGRDTFVQRGDGSGPFHLFTTVNGEHAYAVCGAIFGMRRAARIVTERPANVCGVCEARR